MLTLLNNRRNSETIVLTLGSILKDLFNRKGWPRHVLPKHIHEPETVAGGFDRGRIEFVQRPDMGQNGVEGPSVDLDFVLSQFQPS
jgi:hypothetical protein